MTSNNMFIELWTVFLLFFLCSRVTKIFCVWKSYDSLPSVTKLDLLNETKKRAMRGMRIIDGLYESKDI